MGIKAPYPPLPPKGPYDSMPEDPNSRSFDAVMPAPGWYCSEPYGGQVNTSPLDSMFIVIVGISSTFAIVLLSLLLSS